MSSKPLDRLSRREFISAGLGAVTGFTVLNSLVLGEPAGVPVGRKPNILFILPDQFRNASLGCMGATDVRTPNLDRLAKEGMTFTDCISVYPVCTPYRGMMLTGRFATTNRCVANGVELPDSEISIAQVLRDAGYRTGYIGKWHLEKHNRPFVPKERRKGFDFWAVRNTGGTHYDATYCMDTPDEIMAAGYVPFAQTDVAIDFMTKHKEGPFFLAVSYGPPHPEYDPPKEFDTYDPVGIARRPNVPDDSWKLTQSKYYGSISAIDRCVGRLLDCVEKLGIGENTIIVFTSDHGDMMGSHNLIGKNVPYEESINVPFLVRWRGTVPAGTRTDCLLSTVDIMPTLLGLCGLKFPAVVQGKDLSWAARGMKGEKPSSVLLQRVIAGKEPGSPVREWRGVRTNQYTYARGKDAPWMLFDNSRDPYQMHNLIGKPRGREIQKKLDAELQEWLKRIGDDFATSDAWLARVAGHTSPRFAGADPGEEAGESTAPVRRRRASLPGSDAATSGPGAAKRQRKEKKKKQGGKLLPEDLVTTK